MNCAGVIVIYQNQTVLVETPRGHLSFPKGKRKKDETNLQAALREMEEETGITADQITLIEDHFVDELSKKGVPNIRYFIAYLNSKVSKFTWDPEELSNVKWYQIDQIQDLPNLKSSRQLVFQKVLKIIQSNDK